MKRILVILSFLTFFCVAASGRQIDTLAVQAPNSSAMVNVFATLPFNVNVNQSRALMEAVNLKTARNAGKLQHGYRIRLFFDNRQDAREQSYEIFCAFKSMYPDAPAYRIFDSPFFKVTVGDFRTMAEAKAFMNEIIGRFPTAFIVREDFRFPSLEAPVRKDSAESDDDIIIVSEQ